MENQSKSSSEINKEVERIHNEIQPDYGVIEKDLTAKILKITLQINDKYPELSKYLEELPVTIPDEKKPEINIKNLQTYYESLNSILNKYILEHSDNKEEKK